MRERSGLYMAISNAAVLPDHHKNLYAIVRDRKLYYRMRKRSSSSSSSSVARVHPRILPNTPSRHTVRQHRFHFNAPVKSERISIKYIADPEKRWTSVERVYTAQRKISTFVEQPRFACRRFPTRTR